jgi:hypothetical protein
MLQHLKDVSKDLPRVQAKIQALYDREWPVSMKWGLGSHWLSMM